jgi:hypothetical protein
LFAAPLMNGLGGLLLLSSVVTTPVGNALRTALSCPATPVSSTTNTTRPLDAGLPIESSFCSFLTSEALADITEKLNDAGWKTLAVSKVADIYSTSRLAMTQGQASHLFNAIGNGLLVPIMFTRLLPVHAIIAASQLLSGMFNTGYAGIQELSPHNALDQAKGRKQRTPKPRTSTAGGRLGIVQRIQNNVLLAYNEHMALVGVGKDVGQKIARLMGGKVPRDLKSIYQELASFYPGDLHRIGAMLIYGGGASGLVPMMVMAGPESEIMKLSAVLVLAGGATLNGSLWFESIRNKDKLLMAMIPLQTLCGAFANVWPASNALGTIFGSALMLHFAKLASQQKNQD